MSFFRTFRARLLLILGFLLVATLSVQYYLNLLTQRENDELREIQGRTIVAGFRLGVTSLTQPELRIQDLIAEPGQTFLDDNARQRIKDVLVVDNQWRVYDSLSDEYLPTTDDAGNAVFVDLKDIRDLPPLMEADRLGPDAAQFPNAAAAANAQTADESHAIPIETSKGRWYIVVVVKNDPTAAARRAARPLIFTLAILLISTVVTVILVWRFTRPISYLSNAAREVAEGNLAVRVPGGQRSDEMGQLASRFNEMTAELEKKSELEAKLQQAEKSAVVGRLGSAIAHEIRNPLNYINLTLDHLRSKFAPEEPEKRATFERLTGQLKSEVARINQQITDFLNYSRPANVKLRPLDPREVVENSLRIVEAQAAESDIRINLVEHENVPEISGDPEYLRSLFNNLFINAVHAMESSGGNLNVKISANGDRRFVDFEVSDTGVGIPEENLTKIFEPYFSTKETGTGLGLAIVQKIVDVHNGAIGVKSTEGEGTVFTVRLPSSDKK
ncbi:MAG: ATP-binding protein [Pyrinomonadaceae bacterium]